MPNRSPQAFTQRRPLRIGVDTKNLALFTGGIAAFFRPLLQTWVVQRPQYHFVAVGPPCELPRVDTAANNLQRHTVHWPLGLPRPLRHPFYDNVLFPRAMRALRPDFVFTPYHDVRLPRGTPSVMMVHDTCLHDLPDIYPARIRTYYLHMLRRNLTVAERVLTVSQTSRNNLHARHGLPEDRIGVVPNAIDPQLITSIGAAEQAANLRAERGSGPHLFYPGGSEHRKNIRRLAEAIAVLCREGQSPHLWITGQPDPAWLACLVDLPAEVRGRFHFLGKLDVAALGAQYRASDAVVYPTLCEGFGRVALEAMELGIPIACSDLSVLREVAGDYPSYFDPRNPLDIAASIHMACARGPSEPRRYDNYQPHAVSRAFVAEMDAVLARLRLAHD